MLDTDTETNIQTDTVSDRELQTESDKRINYLLSVSSISASSHDETWRRKEVVASDWFLCSSASG